MLRIRLLSRIGLVAVLATPIMALTAAPASADTCTDIWVGTVCGEVANSSGIGFAIAGGNVNSQYGWCWGDSAPRITGGLFYSCQTTAWLSTGRESDDGIFTDTDSFRVDAGCKIKFNNNSPLANAKGMLWPSPGETRVEDRRGKTTNKWIKVFDTDAIEVDYQTCGGTPTKYWVDTFRTTNGYQDQYCLGNGGNGNFARCNADGVLWAGTNYVFCKVAGDRVYGSGGSTNEWWLLTDLDTVNSGRDGRSFVSAYYLSRWGNDEAKDNSGRVIPTC